MQLQNLVRVTNRKKKRLGRGHASGKGKTAGRGTKGQKARGKVPLWFEGGQTRLIKRLPYLRGKGNPKVSKKPILISLEKLDKLPKNSTVDLDLLVKRNIVKESEAKKSGVKIIGNGDLNVPLKINLPISKGASKKVEKVGGVVISLVNRK